MGLLTASDYRYSYPVHGYMNATPMAYRAPNTHNQETHRRSAEASHDNLMLRAVWMYYNENLTHAEIARKLHTSRVKITRLLQKARDEGLVEIRILKPLPVIYDLARRIEAVFGVDEVVVAPSGPSPDDSLNAVGEAAARYLMQVVPGNSTIGFGWSTTVSRMLPFLHPVTLSDGCTVVELAGSMLGQANPYSVSNRVAEIFHAPLHPLPVPVIIQNAVARQAILSESAIQSALELARTSTLSFVGLGDASPKGTMVSLGYLTPEEMADVRARGAVGEILMRYFGKDGRPIETLLDEQVIGLGWDDICRIPTLVVVAAGPRKVEPICGILRSGLCNCLITDSDTAEMVLADVEKEAHREPAE